MRRALLFCCGVLLGLVGEAILWAGPGVYAHVSETWYSAEWTRITVRGAVLGLIAQGAIAAAGAALCLARAFIPSSPPPAQTGATRGRAAPAAVWRGPLLPIWGILLLVGAVGPARQVFDELEELHDWDVVGIHFSREITDSVRGRIHAGLTLGTLYLVAGGALLVAPLLAKSRGWQLGRRVNGAGCGIAIVGFLLSGVGVLFEFANGLALEGHSESLTRLASFVVLGGTLLAMVGSIVAVVGKSSKAGAQQ
jgi:hypothetical protein